MTQTADITAPIKLATDSERQLWAALRDNPHSSTAGAALAAGIGRSTADKILRRWFKASVVTAEKDRGGVLWSTAAEPGESPKQGTDEQRQSDASPVTSERAAKARTTREASSASEAVLVCAGECGQEKAIRSFPTTGRVKDGSMGRGTVCRSCRDARRQAKTSE